VPAFLINQSAEAPQLLLAGMVSGARHRLVRSDLKGNPVFTSAGAVHFGPRGLRGLFKVCDGMEWMVGPESEGRRARGSLHTFYLYVVCNKREFLTARSHHHLVSGVSCGFLMNYPGYDDSSELPPDDQSRDSPLDINSLCNIILSSDVFFQDNLAKPEIHLDETISNN
jgi:hypothetical protein